MRTIAIMNLKGGVGKTVTALNLADVLRRCGRRVVMVDCDGQANLTQFCLTSAALDVLEEAGITVTDLLQGESEPLWSDNVLPLGSDGLVSLLPADSSLYALDIAAIKAGRRVSLKAFTDFRDAAAEDGVDYMLFDCPPGFTAASVAALMASGEVVIPMLVDGFSTYGVRDMSDQLESLRRAHVGIRIAGVLITQWHNSEVVRQGETLIRGMGVPVFRTVIRRTDKVPESTFMRQPIVAYSPRSAAAMDYRCWVREYLGEEVR